MEDGSMVLQMTSKSPKKVAQGHPVYAA